MVSQIYPSELQLNKAYTSDTEAAILDLHLSISNDIVSTKTYDKCDDNDTGNSLHAWWSTQSRLTTLLSSLIAHQWVGPSDSMMVPT